MKRNHRIAGGAAVVLIGVGAIIGVNHFNGSAAVMTPPPPEVAVAAVQQSDLPVEREWVGTLDGMVNASIKAQVTGYLLRQHYAEGSFVRSGELLFEIDPRPFQAAVDQAAGLLAQTRAQMAQAQAGLVQAEAQLAAARANQQKAQLDEDRYVPLAEHKAITQQDMDNARQNNQAMKAQVAASEAQIETAKAQIEAARAGVKAAEATLETANVNLGFTRLTSPIDGIAGVAATQVGNLVGPAGSAVTTVSTLDPIKANFAVSEQEYLSLARADALHRLRLKLILADGSLHPQTGRFSFADRQIDPATGGIQLTGLFPNPGNTLRPGQYAKVSAAIGVRAGAMLVPQRAVIDTQGTYTVAVVDPNRTVRFAPVRVGDQVGSNWIIEEGVKPGERVVTDGLFHIRPGAVVSPKGGK
jgi:membrane fusion protein (multidrug efflux system)